MTTIEANKTSKDVFYTVIDGSKCEDYIKLKNRNNKEKIDLTDEGVVLTEKLANTLKVKNGDNITIKENDKEKKVKVIGIAENYLYNYICYRLIIIKVFIEEIILGNLVCGMLVL